jgi:hypothetical protein
VELLQPMVVLVLRELLVLMEALELQGHQEQVEQVQRMV